MTSEPEMHDPEFFKRIQKEIEQLKVEMESHLRLIDALIERLNPPDEPERPPESRLRGPKGGPRGPDPHNN